MKGERYQLFLSCTRSLESVLAEEIASCGGEAVRETKAGVHCSGDLKLAYRLCLRSRTASRVFLLLFEGDIAAERSGKNGIGPGRKENRTDGMREADGSSRRREGEEITSFVASLPWEKHLSTEKTISVDASASKSEIQNAGYLALRIKDGIADAFRGKFGARPSVDSRNPDIRVYGRLEESRLMIYLDMAGESLHKRGYRTEKNEAPLRETSAAGMLLKAGWPEMVRDGTFCIDPMCGSGTLAVEAALIAADCAPGLLRDRFGFEAWKKHEGRLWEEVREEERQLCDKNAKRGTTPPVYASDKDPKAVDITRKNAERAGVGELIRTGVHDFADLKRSFFEGGTLDGSGALDGVGVLEGGGAMQAKSAEGPEKTRGASQEGAENSKKTNKSTKESDGGSEGSSGRPVEKPLPRGLIATNPPYGYRLEDEDSARKLYERLGSWMSSEFGGYRAAVLTGGKHLARLIGLRAKKVPTFFNGSIEAALALFELTEDNVFRPSSGTSGEGQRRNEGKRSVELKDHEIENRTERGRGAKEEARKGDETKGVDAVANRLRKNRRSLKKYLRKRGISCYRIYDADIPQYSAAIDVYEDKYFVVQEYAPPKTVDEEKAELRFEEIMEAVVEVFETDREWIYPKRRRRQKGRRQYGKVNGEESGEAASGEQMYIVKEGGLRFFVDFHTYIDTGLFLDHRITRDMIRRMAGGKRVLNLFAYTCTASVYAINGGAEEVVSVDSNNVYLEWGRKNHELNRQDLSKVRILRKDAMEYLRGEPQETFDLIFIDPPTFSNRKGAEEDFQIQEKHEELIKRSADLLNAGGTIIFSTNYRKFIFSKKLEEEFAVQENTAETLPKDFERNGKIHRSWIIRKSILHE